MPGADRQLADFTLATVGPVDLLVAGAGIGWAGEFLDMPPHAIDEVLDINVLATPRLVRLVLPGMVAAGAGRVVLVGSLAGSVAVRDEAVYSAAKARSAPSRTPCATSCGEPAWGSRTWCPVSSTRRSSSAGAPLPPVQAASGARRARGRRGTDGGGAGPGRGLRARLAAAAVPGAGRGSGLYRAAGRTVRMRSG